MAFDEVDNAKAAYGVVSIVRFAWRGRNRYRVQVDGYTVAHLEAAQYADLRLTIPAMDVAEAVADGAKQCGES